MVGKSSSRTPRLALDRRPMMDKHVFDISHDQQADLNRPVQT